MPRSSEAVLEAGVIKFNRGLYRESAADFSAALSLEPGSAKARLFRSLACKMVGDTAGALRDMEEAKRLNPRSASLRLSCALMLRDLGDVEGSLRECGQAARLEARSAAAHELRSDLEERRGRRAEALRSLEKAIRLDPGRADWRLRAAGWLLDAGRLGSALRQCEEAARLEPACAAVHALKHDLELKRGLKERALDSLRRAIRLAPNRADWRLKEAGLLLELGRKGEAARECEAALRLEPGSADLQLRGMELLRSLGRPERALELCRKAAGGAARSAALLEMRADLELELGLKSEALESLEGLAALADSPRRRLQAAGLLKERGELDAALRHCRAALRLDPRGATAYELKADLEAALGRRLEALKSIQAAVALEPRSAAFRLKAALLLRETGDLAKALGQCQAAVAAAPDVAVAYELKSEIELTLERKDAAWRSLERALELEPRSSALHVKAAAVLKETGYLRSALKECEAALSLDPKSEAACRMRCLIELRSEDKDAAALSLRRVLELAPRSAQTRLWAAGVLRDMGDYEEALSSLRSAIRLDSRLMPAYMDLGQLYLWRGEAARAAACADKALALSPRLWASYRLRGAAAVLQGRLRRAVRELDKAAVLFAEGGRRRRMTRLRYIIRTGHYTRPVDPGDYETYIWRAEAKRRLGKFSEARADIKKALALSAQCVGALANKALIDQALDGRISDQLYRLIKIHFPRPINDTMGAVAPTAESMASLLRFMGGNRTGTVTFISDEPVGPRLRQHVDYFHSDDQLEVQEKIKLGDVDGVMREFDRHLSERPHDAYMLSARGETCLWIGRYRQALRDLKKSLLMNPNLAWPDVGICGVYTVMGDYRKALHHLDLADKKMVPVQLMSRWRAEIYRRMGNPGRALVELQKSSELFPYKPSYWLNLALVKGALGDSRGQREIFLRLCQPLKEFFADAAREGGIAWKAPESMASGAIGRLLEKALDLMKGNRSSWMYTYVLGSGKVKHIELKPLHAGRVPANFINHSAAFLRYFALNKNS